MEQDQETRKRNRHKSQVAARTFFWCNCDRDMVTVFGKHRKCSNCGIKWIDGTGRKKQFKS